jgi:opacity protein-like surface antigen
LHSLCLFLLFTPILSAEGGATFIGGHAGLSTLSADGTSSVGSPTTSSSYKPENGFAWMVFGGRHFSEYVSVQMTVGGNRNDLRLSSIQIADGVETSYEQARQIAMYTVLVEAMVYVRNRSSRVRPYLSAGPGVAHTRSTPGATVTRGAALLPGDASRRDLGFRAAVGMDVRLRSNFWFRYSFGETIQRNPVSRLLSPRGTRNLANFQNLFGAFWQF